jgi:hypothetical protein
MDERQRKIFEKAHAILDRRKDDERAHQEWLARHYDPVTERYDLGEDEEMIEQPPPQQQQRSGASGLIYKTHNNDTPPPPSEPAQDSVMFYAIAEALALQSIEMRKEMREHVAKELAGLRDEIAGLRADLTITRTIVANRNVFGVVRKEAKSNVA